MRPEEALEAARARGGRGARARGAYADDLEGFAVEPTDRVSTEQLLEWAVIEPDLDLVRSTRRLRRADHRGPSARSSASCASTSARSHAQQTRFNLHVVVRLAELEERARAARAARA